MYSNNNKDFDKALGLRLRTLRKMRKWSQIDLANKLSTSSQMIGRYEAGKSSCPPELLHACSNLFAVPVSYFFGSDYQDEMFSMDKTQLRAIQAITNLPNDDMMKRMYEMAVAITDSCEKYHQAKVKKAA